VQVQLAAGELADDEVLLAVVVDVVQTRRGEAGGFDTHVRIARADADGGLERGPLRCREEQRHEENRVHEFS
jgi:hypothetical protein